VSSKNIASGILAGELEALNAGKLRATRSKCAKEGVDVREYVAPQQRSPPPPPPPPSFPWWNVPFLPVVGVGVVRNARRDTIQLGPDAWSRASEDRACKPAIKGRDEAVHFPAAGVPAADRWRAL